MFLRQCISRVARGVRFAPRRTGRDLIRGCWIFCVLASAFQAALPQRGGFTIEAAATFDKGVEFVRLRDMAASRRPQTESSLDTVGLLKVMGAPKTAVLLIDHGSRVAEANVQLQGIAERLRLRLAKEQRGPVVEIAHMELSAPTISEGYAACVQAGATHVVAIPCFLSRGRHVTEDIPALLREAAKSYSRVTHEIAPPLAEHAGFIELLASAARTKPAEDD